MGGSDALFTALIPTYRRPGKLEAAVRSALAQTMPRLKVLISDNASGDETSEVAARLAAEDPRVEYHCHPENIGANRNFRSAIERVCTPYFSILSDDDLLLPTFYEDALASFERHPSVCLFCSQVILFHADTGRWEPAWLPGRTWNTGTYDGGMLAARMFSEHHFWTGLAFRSEAIRRVGLPPAEVPNLDLPFLVRVTAVCDTAVSETPGAIFVFHEQNTSSSFDVSQTIGSFVYTASCTDDLQGAPAALPAELRRVLVHHMRQRLRYGFRRGNWREMEATARVIQQQSRLRFGEKLKLWLKRLRWVPPLFVFLAWYQWHKLARPDRHAPTAANLEALYEELSGTGHTARPKASPDRT